MSAALRWRLPDGIILRSVEDLSLPSSLDLVWRRDNASPVLRRFVDQVIETAEAASREPPSAARSAALTPNH
jgi:hypothetical protein